MTKLFLNMPLVTALLPRIRAGRDRDGSQRSIFIVATQSVEAGADLDFDALVTEVAPLDSLRQRFGRLDRLGRLSETQSAGAQAVILAASDQVAKKAKPDPIYGEAPRITWDWLQTKSHVEGKGKNAKAVIDFGVAASMEWLPKGTEELKSCIAPRRDAPVLLPRDIAFWTMTSPVPAVDPEVSLYLHGPETSPGDVEIVWRADLEDGIRQDGQKQEDRWKERVVVCPPSVLEALSVPIAEAKRWLRQDASADIADLEASENEENDFRAPMPHARVLRWRGPDDEKTEVIDGHRISPGDLIVVPAARGGCDQWGWAPQLREKVNDIGDEANEQGRGRLIVRFSPELLKQVLRRQGIDRIALEARAERFSAFSEELRESNDREVRARTGEFSGLPEAWRDRLDRFGAAPVVYRDSEGRPLALEQRIRNTRAQSKASSEMVRQPPYQPEAIGDAVTEDDDGMRNPVGTVLLAPHCKGVGARARDFAKKLGLAHNLVNDIELAGMLHDAGKAHPAFKRLLYGSAMLAAIGGPPLAKSAKLPRSYRAYVEACHRAGLTEKARHEVASLAFAEEYLKTATVNDAELVLWLIGTHHGYGRPFFPSVEWPDATGERFDLGNGGVTATCSRSVAELTPRWIDLAARVQRRYGPWGLARLEAILRLADHRQSEVDGENAVTEAENREAQADKMRAAS